MDLATHRARFEAVLTEEPVAFTLAAKCHYSVDVMLDHTLMICLPKSESMDVKRVSFLLKVDFLIALGILAAGMRQVFEKANAIRNRFAHDPYAQLEKSDLLQARGVLKKALPGFSNKELEATTDPLEGARCLFGICFYSLENCLKSSILQQVQSQVLSGMMQDSLRSVTRPGEEGMNTDERYMSRMTAFISEHHPEIELDRINALRAK